MKTSVQDLRDGQGHHLHPNSALKKTSSSALLEDEPHYANLKALMSLEEVKSSSSSFSSSSSSPSSVVKGRKGEGDRGDLTSSNELSDDLGDFCDELGDLEEASGGGGGPGGERRSSDPLAPPPHLKEQDDEHTLENFLGVDVTRKLRKSFDNLYIQDEESAPTASGSNSTVSVGGRNREMQPSLSSAEDSKVEEPADAVSEMHKLRLRLQEACRQEIADINRQFDSHRAILDSSRSGVFGSVVRKSSPARENVHVRQSSMPSEIEDSLKQFPEKKCVRSHRREHSLPQDMLQQLKRPEHHYDCIQDVLKDEDYLKNTRLQDRKHGQATARETSRGSSKVLRRVLSPPRESPLSTTHHQSNETLSAAADVSSSSSSSSLQPSSQNVRRSSSGSPREGSSGSRPVASSSGKPPISQPPPLPRSGKAHQVQQHPPPRGALLHKAASTEDHSVVPQISDSLKQRSQTLNRVRPKQKDTQMFIPGQGTHYSTMVIKKKKNRDSNGSYKRLTGSHETLNFEEQKPGVPFSDAREALNARRSSGVNQTSISYSSNSSTSGSLTRTHPRQPPSTSSSVGAHSHHLNMSYPSTTSNGSSFSPPNSAGLTAPAAEVFPEDPIEPYMTSKQLRAGFVYTPFADQMQKSSISQLQSTTNTAPAPVSSRKIDLSGHVTPVHAAEKTWC